MRCQILTYNVHGLPWAKDFSAEICSWIKSVKPSIVCLQEVFLDSMRNYYKEQLTRYGYTVVIPRDSDVSLLPSGLLTAFLEKDYRVVRDCFYPYMTYYNIEVFVNKGFHTVHLRQLKDGGEIVILNTHTQSTTEVSWLFGNKYVEQARKQQFDQILEHTRNIRTPMLLVGDVNCELSPHPHIRFLRMPLMKKHTFLETGEDLDHIGWFPLQYAECGFCDIEKRGPVMESCAVTPLSFSDHFPVLATVRIP